VAFSRIWSLVRRTTANIADATRPRSPAFAMTLRSTPINAPCPKCIAQFTGSG
jgi:hypothetical protein